MGRTVPTYREAIEREIERWKKFRKVLRRKERESFDRMIDATKRHSSAGSQASMPEPFQSMVMSVLLEHQRKLELLEKEINELREGLEEE